MNELEYKEMLMQEERLRYICWVYMENHDLVLENMEKVREELTKYQQFRFKHDDFNSELADTMEEFIEIFGEVI